MGLNIVTSNEDFKPFAKYNAKAGRWYKSVDKEDIEVKDPVFVADFANIKTGWFYLKAGQAPQIVIDPSLDVMADRPELTYTDDKGKVRQCFNRGFTLDLFSEASFDGVVEISGTSKILNNAINAIYSEYEEGLKANAGKLPVISVEKTEAIKSDFGTNYAPTFKIEKWVDRPSAFDESVDNTPVSEPVAQAAGNEF